MTKSPLSNDFAFCQDCGDWIIRADDDALICTKCGGRNRRVDRHAWIGEAFGIGSLVAIAVMILWILASAFL